MTPESFIQIKAAEAVKALYQTEIAPESLQVQVTRKEFEGDYTLVTFEFFPGHLDLQGFRSYLCLV